MPGVTCWDIDYFLSFEQTGEVVALESDPATAAVIRVRAAGLPVVVHEQSTTEFLSTTDDRFDVVYLDYFANFNQQVEIDVQILMRRRLIRRRGAYAVSFYGARESIVTQARHRMLFEDLDTLRPSNESWGGMSRNRQRCVAFNSLIARLRFCSLFVSEPSSANRAFVTTTVPKWSSYATSNCDMLLGCFSVTGYSKHPDRRKVFRSMDGWYVRGRFGIRRWTVSTATGFSLMQGGAAMDAVWGARVARFYRRNHYTPARVEIGAHIRNWQAIVRGVGLCPRVNATDAEIDAEVMRIVERDGYVTRASLKKAKIGQRPLLVREGLRGVCRRLGVQAGASRRRPIAQ
jgi:hypothetical protein|tara:strand:+ start:292 stop:1329 length:1038 start_codon:yes stop_codon:yes gene_type:complete